MKNRYDKKISHIKRKQIFSITLDPDLYHDAMQVAPDGNFSKCVTEALEDYLQKKEIEALAEEEKS